MKGERLKYPMIASQLYELRLDIEDWAFQIEQKNNAGGWSYNKIREIFKDRLAEFGSLLDKVNGARLRKDEERELQNYKRFFWDMKLLLRDAKSKKERR